MKYFILLVMAILAGCSSGNLDYVKERAEQKWMKQGFSVVDYEGYEWGLWGFNEYGGARVWYRLKKNTDNGITYSGAIQRWGDELHVYGPVAHDAIKP